MARRTTDRSRAPALAACALAVAAPSCAARVTPEPLDTPQAAAIVTDIEARWPAARGWFQQVAGMRHDTTAETLAPRWDSIRSPIVLRTDPAGQRFAPHLPRYANGTTEVALDGHPGFWIRTTPRDARAAQAETHDGVIVYPGAFAGADLLYKLTPTRVDEYVYVRSPGGPHRFSYRLERGPDVGDFATNPHGMEVFDRAGVARIRVARPFARGADGVRRNGTLTLDGDILTLDVDTTGMAFPVLIDPDWATSGRMGRERFVTPAIVLADGDVLMASGCTLAICPSGLGMPWCSELLEPTERWSALSNTWRVVASVAQRRFAFAGGRLPDGRVLISGGCTERACTSTTHTTEVYDPTLDRWSPGPPRATSTAFSSAITLGDGRLLVAGGCSPMGCTAVTEIYVPARGAWQSAAPLLHPRGLHATTLLPDGRVLVTGGCDTLACGHVLADAEVYDPASDRWSPAGTMASPRASHTTTALDDGSVLIAGGCASAACNPTLNSAETWDPRAVRFTPAAAMTTARHNFSAARLGDGTVITMGGCGPTAVCTSSTEVFDPRTGRWAPGPVMAAARGYFTGGTLPDGRQIVIGGCNSDTCIPWTELLSRVDPNPDAGVRDAGPADVPPPDVPVADAVADVPGDADASTAPMGPARFSVPGPDGCNCRVPGAPYAPARPPAGALLALLAAAAWRRRQRPS